MRDKDLKRLPLNTACFSGVYADNIFYNAICTSEDKMGELLCSLEIPHLKEYDWEFSKASMSMEKDENQLRLYQSGNYKGMKGHFYRKLKSEDEIILKLSYIQDTMPEVEVGICLGTKQQIKKVYEEGISQLDYIYKYFILYGDCITSQGIHYKNLGHRPYNFPIYLKLQYKDGEGRWYFSEDGISWSEPECSQIPYSKDTVVGVSLLFDQSEIRYWNYINRLRLCLDCQAGTVDYFMKIGNGKRSHIVSQYLTSNESSLKPIRLSGIPIMKYLITNISYNRYIAASYLASHKKVLIFGFDREKQNFDIVFQKEDETWGTGTLSFEETEHGLEDKIEMIEFRLNNCAYSFDKEVIADTLQKYLDSFDYRKEFRILLPQKDDMVFGHKVYQKLIEEERFLTKTNLCLLKERSEILTEFLKYLMCTDYLSSCEETALLSKSKKIQDEFVHLILYVQEEDCFTSKAKESLSEIAEWEAQIFEELLEWAGTKSEKGEEE